MQHKKSLIFLFTILAVFSLLLAPVGAASAQGPVPPLPHKQRVQIAPASLDEVQNYYGRLADIKGPLGVVVELEDMPAALIYAQGQRQAAALARNQANLIVQKQDSFTNALQAQGVQATELFRTQKVFNGIWLRVDSQDLKKLLSIPGVKAIHPIVPKKLQHTTSVPLIGAPQVWAGLSAARGEGIKIGIIDGGIDYIHTNFGGPGAAGYTGQDFTTLGEAGNLFPTAKVVGGWDFVGDAYDADTFSVPVPDPDPMDCGGHGSHVAGSAAGFGVNADGTTYVESLGDGYADLGALTSAAYTAKFRIGPGVAPKALLYALRVFGCAGSTSVVEQAIEWALDPNDDGDFSDHLDVINMSLGSDFGSEYDTSAIASNNAALAGVLVVASAGNAEDVYYITGAPAVARYAISVASSVDSSGVVSAFEVTAAPSMTLGAYHAVESAEFGPQTFSQAGDLVYATPPDGCTAVTGVSGKIALIDRGSCDFVTKVKNAQTAGALGVLVANNINTFPFGMGGTDATITIPSMMTTLAIGDSLKTDLLAGVVTVLLTSANRNQLIISDPAIEDTLSSFSSRGPARAGTLLKPDIAAPGDTIFSTLALSGDEGASYDGTSMASPHIAGVMALLKQIHPTWSVAELKALAMNTASNDLYTGLSQTGLTYTPSRVGAGRANAANAALSQVLAYYKNDPGQVSVAFGEVEVVDNLLGVDQSFVKSITIANKSASSAVYNAAFDSRYQTNAGLTFTLLDAGNAPLANPVTIPANSTLEIKIKADVDAATLERALDATVVITDRQYFSEGGGYVTLTSTGIDPALRVPVHIAARPAAAMNVLESAINLPAAATGSFSLNPSGIPVVTGDDASLVSIMELLGESPNDAFSNGPTDAADLRYIGAASDYPFYPITDPDPDVFTAAMYFGIATYGKWDTSNTTEFDIYIDVDEDGINDYVVFNTNQGFFTGQTDDVMLTIFCPLPFDYDACDAWYYVNGYDGFTNTNLFNNNVMTLMVPLEGIGLTEGVNTDFDFYVVSYHWDAAGPVDVSDLMSYDVANPAFTAVDMLGSGMPMWFDIPCLCSTFNVDYDKTAIAANHSKGLLLLHHHNAANTAETVRLSPTVISSARANPNPTNAASVDFTVTFSTDVTGVDNGDFALTTTGGLSGVSVVAVTGSGDTRTVTVNTGSGNGTIRLDVLDNDSILDADSNHLGGMGAGNGDFTGGEVYTIQTFRYYFPIIMQ